MLPRLGGLGFCLCPRRAVRPDECLERLEMFSELAIREYQ